MRSKAHSYHHTNYRLNQRYKFKITREDYNKLHLDIQHNKYLSASKINKERSLYLLHIKNDVVIVGYNNIYNRITTALPFKKKYYQHLIKE